MKNIKKRLSRRKFLSTSTISITGATLTGLAPALVIGEDNKPKANKEKQKRNIIYRKLGKKGPEMPIVSMGSGSVINAGLIQASIELGVRHFDTSTNYLYGRSEQMLGNIMSRMGVRDKIIVGTKVNSIKNYIGENNKQTTRIVHNVTEKSLKRLKTDYIDILYIPDIVNPKDMYHPAVFEAFAELKEQKKILLAGTTTHSNMTEVIYETMKHDIFDVIMPAINFTMKDDTALLKAIKDASEKGLSIIAMKTQAGGMRYLNAKSIDKYSTSTIMTAALKWVLRNTNITSAIPAYNNYEHMNEDFSVAYDLEYNDEERNFLKDNKATASVDFCRQCRMCLSSCPHNVELPTLMRTFMYAAQYTNFNLARTALNEIPAEKGLKQCRDCSACVARCANNVNIPHRIEQLKLIYC